MPGPLEGVRVIDVTTMVSGPLATMMLADQGADVIKVESPAGDHARRVATRRGGFSASFLNNNRNKRSVVLDLKQPGGVDALKRMSAGADVFIQNFRPGVAERLGVGAQAVRAANPRIIYASICGFGFTGPYAQKPVFDPLVQALSSLTTVQAGSDAQRPRLIRTILPDKLSAFQASQAICAALFARERSGEGQNIRLSMLDTIVYFLWSSDMGGHTFVGDELEAESAQSWIDLIYETVDGYVSIAIMQDKDWRSLAAALERPDLLEDERFMTAELRDVNKDARTRLTQEAVKPFTTREILERLETRDVPCAPVLTRREMIRHPQIAANGVVVNTEHPDAGTLRQARQPVAYSGTPAAIHRGAPRHGADTRAVLSELGFTDQEIAALEASGAAINNDDRSAAQ